MNSSVTSPDFRDQFSVYLFAMYRLLDNQLLNRRICMLTCQMCKNWSLQDSGERQLLRAKLPSCRNANPRYAHCNITFRHSCRRRAQVQWQPASQYSNPRPKQLRKTDMLSPQLQVLRSGVITAVGLARRSACSHCRRHSLARLQLRQIA